MADNHVDSHSRSGVNTVWQIVGRLIGASIVLAITAFFTPGFHISSFWSLAAAAVVLTLMDYLIVRFTGLNASPFGKGFVGFILSVAILYRNPILCCRIFNFLDGSNHWCTNLWSNSLLLTW